MTVVPEKLWKKNYLQLFYENNTGRRPNLAKYQILPMHTFQR